MCSSKVRSIAHSCRAGIDFEVRVSTFAFGFRCRFTFCGAADDGVNTLGGATATAVDQKCSQQ